MDWFAETFRATIVLVAASIALILPGIAGIPGSLPLAGALLAIAGLLYVMRPTNPDGPVVFGHRLGSYVAVLWLGALIAALVVTVFLDASPAELQALGGVLGLIGMANFFLRPLYRYGYQLIAALGSFGR